MIDTKLDGKTKDIVSENISKMKELFPTVFKEDVVDYDKLKLLLEGGGRIRSLLMMKDTILHGKVKENQYN